MSEAEQTDSDDLEPEYDFASMKGWVSGKYAARLDKVRIIDQQEGRDILDEAARKYLGISGEEFLKRWDAGEYAGQADTPNVMAVVSLIHFAR